MIATAVYYYRAVIKMAYRSFERENMPLVLRGL
jgi:hypothetical protein